MNYTKFHCHIDIAKNPLNLEINDYLSVALRNNKKRRFLFISKDLGKHLPCKPKKVDELGEKLVYSYKLKYKNYKAENQLVIGFAETATSLGHSFYNYLESAKYFIHTTREEVHEFNNIDFVEEHSHATEQKLYIDNLKSLDKIDSIVLVDDEITTAKTCINIIKHLTKLYGIKKYVIASILNWIDKERKDEIDIISKELKCKIEFVYLFNGSFDFNLYNEELLIDKIEEVDLNNKNTVEINYINLDFKKYINNEKYIKYTGRFGINREEQEELKKIIKLEGEKLNIKKRDYKVLALGVEEFMYIPMMLSKEISGDVYYHSITRSPIIPMKKEGYPIKTKHMLNSFYNDNINYLYNLDANKYEECFIFLEVCKDEKRISEFINIIKGLGIKVINIVMC